MILHGDKVKLIWFGEHNYDYVDGEFTVYTLDKKEDGFWELINKDGVRLLINPLNPNLKHIQKVS